MSDLLGPPLPPELTRAWRAFLQLHARRPVGTQFHRIPFTELRAYTEIMHTDLTPLDLACIETADAVYQARLMERVAPNPEGTAPSTE